MLRKFSLIILVIVLGALLFWVRPNLPPDVSMFIDRTITGKYVPKPNAGPEQLNVAIPDLAIYDMTTYRVVAYSPDRRYAAIIADYYYTGSIWSARKLYLVSVGNPMPKLVMDEMALQEEVRFTADGKKLVVFDESYDQSATQIDITAPEPTVSNLDVIMPEPHPTNPDLIAGYKLFSDSGKPQHLQLVITRADGTGTVIAYDGFGHPFAWSPDGTLLAFVDTENHLRMVSPDGTSLRTLTEKPVNFFKSPLRFSPDGNKIAFIASNYRETTSNAVNIPLDIFAGYIDIETRNITMFNVPGVMEIQWLSDDILAVSQIYESEYYAINQWVDTYRYRLILISATHPYDTYPLTLPKDTLNDRYPISIETVFASR